MKNDIIGDFALITGPKCERRDSMNNETAIKILSTRNYMCGECPFSGPDCKGCRLADALDLAIEALGDRILNNTDFPNNMTLIPTSVLDDLTKTTRELGEWIFEKANNEQTDGYVCSICGRSFHTRVPYFSEFKYCPNCGALMIASSKCETQ